MIVLRWVLFILYATILFLFSGRPMSSASTMTQGFLKLFPELSRATVQALVFYTRKGFHVIGYFLATCILYRAVKVTPGLKKHPYLFAFLLTLLFAIIDEWYQLYLPFRSGSIYDVLIDTVGIGLALIATRLTVQRQKKAPNIS